MTITYCCIISKEDKITMAESTLKESYDVRIHKLIKSILKGKTSEVIEIENDQIITYYRTKKIIFVCVSAKSDTQGRTVKFMEAFVNSVVKEFGSIDNVIPQSAIHKFYWQNRMEQQFNTLINDFDTGALKSKGLIEDMNKDICEIKQDMNVSIKKMLVSNGDLEQMLITSKNLNKDSTDYRKEAKELEYSTRCIKPWMIYMLITFIILFVVYTVFAFYRCGNMSLFCKKE